MAMKIISQPTDEIKVDDIDYNFADNHAIAYCTVSGRICKLVRRESTWRFENIMNANTGSSMYECTEYRYPREALKAVMNKNSTRDLQAFDSDLEFAIWAVEKLRIHTKSC